MAVYALMFLNAVVHSFVKTRLLRGESGHLTSIAIHSAHVVWISVVPVIVVAAEYTDRTHDFSPLLPTLFLASFYVHELSVRWMTLDVKIHHAVFVVVFMLTLYDETSIVFVFFNTIEFGHLFHIGPYQSAQARISHFLGVGSLERRVCGLPGRQDPRVLGGQLIRALLEPLVAGELQHAQDGPDRDSLSAPALDVP